MTLVLDGFDCISRISDLNGRSTCLGLGLSLSRTSGLKNLSRLCNLMRGCRISWRLGNHEACRGMIVLTFYEN